MVAEVPAGAPHRARAGASHMIWSWTLYRYLAKQFVTGVAHRFRRHPLPGLFDLAGRSAQPYRGQTRARQCRVRHEPSEAARSGPDPAALRRAAGRGVQLRAAVAQPGIAVDPGCRRLGLEPAGASPDGGRAAGHLLRRRGDAGLGAAARTIFRAWKPNICADSPRSWRSRATGCGCARAMPITNR